MSTPALSADRVRADVTELLGCEPAEIALDENLFDRGLDSVRTMSLVERWRAGGAAGLEFPDLAERPELGHWTTVLGKASA
ncbi:phosphopantetheine-binding protein [Amycolatopsis sp. CA-230715]|uniref:phosphopantetheine-binding protein n=1 Tax=Amycolatopsis sp. CA-230715 TaxID=2745196 RepID=UPI001C035687|nr:phosphopantetheine-binding protein [Amycolatopsis sp. CA-230715]QWF83947.1 Isochorismatase [Amycolatopsis sp. CA-230715]